jgi:hypothetical protein
VVSGPANPWSSTRKDRRLVASSMNDGRFPTFGGNLGSRMRSATLASRRSLLGALLARQADRRRSGIKGWLMLEPPLPHDSDCGRQSCAASRVVPRHRSWRRTMRTSPTAKKTDPSSRNKTPAIAARSPKSCRHLGGGLTLLFGPARPGVWRGLGRPASGLGRLGRAAASGWAGCSAVAPRPSHCRIAQDRPARSPCKKSGRRCRIGAEVFVAG